MNALLPVRPATVPQSQLELKLDQANHPEKYGMTLNDEARRFHSAVDAGFLPHDGFEPTLEGYGTFLYWLGAGGPEKVKEGLYDWIAWNDKFDGVPESQARSKIYNWGADSHLWFEAINRHYQPTAAPAAEKPLAGTGTQVPASSTVWSGINQAAQGLGTEIDVSKLPVESPSATLTKLRELVSYAEDRLKMGKDSNGLPTLPEGLSWVEEMLLVWGHQELAKAEQLATTQADLAARGLDLSQG